MLAALISLVSGLAEYLNATYGVDGEVTWATAGRNLEKLVEVRDRISAAAALPLLIADASDAASLAGLVAQAKVIITTVGPYQRYGQPLVTACAHTGTHHVDLRGEPGWMAQMIPLLDAPARASGAHRVFMWLRLQPVRSGCRVSCRMKPCGVSGYP